MLVLQAWYGLSDPKLEHQAADRFSFRRFLGYTEQIHNAITVWLLRRARGDEEHSPAVAARVVDLCHMFLEHGVLTEEAVAGKLGLGSIGEEARRNLEE